MILFCLRELDRIDRALFWAVYMKHDIEIGQTLKQFDY